MRILKKEWLAISVQLLILLFGVAQLTVFNGMLNGNPNGQYMGYSQQSMLKPNINSDCDKIVKTHIPKWYRGGWRVQCSDELRKPKSSDTVYGVTIRDSHNILISRKTPSRTLVYTLDHEYAHSVAFDEKFAQSKRWGEWVKLLTDHYGVIEKLTYFDDPNEILADNVSRCYNHMENELMGFITVKCSEVYKYFPEYKVN